MSVCQIALNANNGLLHNQFGFSCSGRSEPNLQEIFTLYATLGVSGGFPRPSQPHPGSPRFLSVLKAAISRPAPIFGDAVITHLILLVDDNPNDLELALSAIGGEQVGGSQPEVVVAGGGQEAMHLLRCAVTHGRPLPDLILLDLKMPQMDGLAVLDAIRAEDSLRDIPVVMLTTSGEDRDIRDSYAHGASAYVIKPLDFAQFSEAMRTIQAFWTNLNRHPRVY